MKTPQGVSPWSDVLSFKTITGGNVEYMDAYNQFTIAIPNPANDLTTIKFVLSDPEIVNINIFDIKGNLIKTIINYNATSGENRITVSLADVNTGLYYYQLNTSNGIYTNKIEVIR